MTTMTTTRALAEAPRPSRSVTAHVASDFEPVACYVCGADSARPFIEGEDDLTGRPGRFTFVRCAACGLAYQNPRLTLSAVRTYYDAEYIAHRRRRHAGLSGRLFEGAMARLDRAKLRIVDRHKTIDANSSVLDVGCGAGSFLQHVVRERGATAVGVDFADLADSPSLRGVEFYQGLFYHQPLERGRFDLVTMWHFLEHDYDPARSLRYAREVLADDGVVVIEVPRLDSLSFRLFGSRWPGLQAPQHTALYDRRSLQAIARAAGLEVVRYLPYGAFPPYFYLFCGLAFSLLKGRGLNLGRAMPLYFAGAVVAAPFMPVLQRMNFAMQTIVCRKARA